jgi:hypothetical protein
MIEHNVEIIGFADGTWSWVCSCTQRGKGFPTDAAARAAWRKHVASL